jgi:hypothetical protein
MARQAKRGGGGSSHPFATPALEVAGWLAPRPSCFTPWKDPIPIVQKAGWAPWSFSTGKENLSLRPACSESCHLSDQTEQNKGIWQILATLAHCRVVFVAVRMFTHDASSVSRGTVSLRVSSNGCHPISHSHRYRLFRLAEHFYCCVESLHVSIENNHSSPGVLLQNLKIQGKIFLFERFLKYYNVYVTITL